MTVTKGVDILKSTKNWTIRNIPAEVVEKVKEIAAENHRSFNNEVIAILEKASKEKK